MIKVCIVMPARFSKPLGANLIELKEYYASKGFEKDSQIVESAISHGCTAFRFNDHKIKHKGRDVVYYVSMIFEFMFSKDASNFMLDYSKIIE